MDDDDAVPPPIRRSPRATAEWHTALRNTHVADDDLDEVPPAVSRRRSTSLENGPPLQQQQHRSPSSNINPLTSHPVDPALTSDSRHRFSHPFWEQLRPFQSNNSNHPAPTPIPLPLPLPLPLPIPHRSPARLKSFRTNKRLPPHLRRRTSLETINSVTTTASNASDEDEPDPLDARAPSPYFFTLEDDPASTPVPSDEYSLDSSFHSSSVSSQQSVKPTITPVNSRDSEPHSPKSLFRKMTHRKSIEHSSVPERLVIERKVSFDRTSHRSSLSGSNQSLPLEQPFSLGQHDAQRSQSGSSSGWSASNFDITSLSEADIKKCKKKGINPALYAEMKAARKGKWTSPIAGNTFL
jgi:hypothetical protein